MAVTRIRSATSVVRALGARLAASCLIATALFATLPPALGQDQLDRYETLPEPALADEEAPELAAPLAPTYEFSEDDQAAADRVLDPNAADFDSWEPLVEREPRADDPLEEPFSAFEDTEGEAEIRPFDWMRHWGFHHSSTEGPFVHRSVPMERTSWLNRPFHLDVFAGPLMSDGPVSGRVEQSNDVMFGLRLGFDFDYYWGGEWRMGWGEPTLMAAIPNPAVPGSTILQEYSGSYMVSDVSLVYYPWGDTKVRPYVQFGLGFTEVGSVLPNGLGQEEILLGMPFGAGVQFPMTHWLAFRMGIVDNLAFGSHGIDTMNNILFSAGMEMRMGARPNSYWPWRSARTIW